MSSFQGLRKGADEDGVEVRIPKGVGGDDNVKATTPFDHRRWVGSPCVRHHATSLRGIVRLDVPAEGVNQGVVGVV